MSKIEAEAQQALIDEMRRLAVQIPRVRLLGKEFVFHPEVFHPGFSVDEKEFMTEKIVKTVEEELMKKYEETSFDFLEVGCGAGYTAILAALASQKCKAWATDISEIAVKNTIENAKLHGVEDRVTAVTADVFDHKEIAGREFDMIYWSFPWFSQQPGPETQLDMFMRGLVDPGYQAFRRYLAQAGKVLKKTGRIFVSFSFLIGSKELFETVLKETGWSYKISSKNTFPIVIADKRQELDVSIMELFKQE